MRPAFGAVVVTVSAVELTAQFSHLGVTTICCCDDVVRLCSESRSCTVRTQSLPLAPGATETGSVAAPAVSAVYDEAAVGHVAAVATVVTRVVEIEPEPNDVGAVTVTPTPDHGVAPVFV